MTINTNHISGNVHNLKVVYITQMAFFLLVTGDLILDQWTMIF